MRKLGLCFAVTLCIALPMNVDAQRRQRRNTAQRSTAGTLIKVQPAYTLTGRMMDNRISARTSNDRPSFDYVLTGARVVNGRLELQGVATPTGGAGTIPLAATLLGTTSRARNPWPNASSAPVRQQRAAAGTTSTTTPEPTVAGQQQTGRETRTAEAANDLSQLSQTTQSAYGTRTPTPVPPRGQGPAPTGEVTEQTQSLYTAIDYGTGCELIYLRIQLPAQLASRAGARPNVQLGVVLAPQDNQIGERINSHLCRVMRALDGEQPAETINAQLKELNDLLSQVKSNLTGQSRASKHH